MFDVFVFRLIFATILAEIYANSGNGLEISSGANPHVIENTIKDGSTHGIIVTESAKGKMEGNTITANNMSNVLITGNSEPSFVKNVISDGEPLCCSRC